MLTPAGVQPVRPRRNRVWLIYFACAAILVALLAWATLNELGRSSNREATVNLGGTDLVTIRFTTDPYPPLPTGAVRLTFMPMDARQRPVALDRITFDYGQEGQEQPVGSGEAQLLTDGGGQFYGTAQFPSVGNWWVRVRVQRGNSRAETRFTFYVKPAQ